MNRIRRTITVLAFSLLLLPGSVSALPSDTSDAPSPEAIVQAELMRDLTAESVTTQKAAMLRIREYAYMDRYNTAFFRTLVEPLQDIVAGGETDEIRLVAISALSSIGTDAALNGLRAQVDRFDSPRLAQATQSVLTQHDGARLETPERSRMAE